MGTPPPHLPLVLPGEAAAAELFHAIQNIIIRALLAVQPAMINDKHCFELYGYDVMIDANLKPWLIEVSAASGAGAVGERKGPVKTAVRCMCACLCGVGWELSSPFLVEGKGGGRGTGTGCCGGRGLGPHERCSSWRLGNGGQGRDGLAAPTRSRLRAIAMRACAPVQVNASPSLTASDRADWVLKTAMLEVSGHRGERRGFVSCVAAVATHPGIATWAQTASWASPLTCSVAAPRQTSLRRTCSTPLQPSSTQNPRPLPLYPHAPNPRPQLRTPTRSRTHGPCSAQIPSRKIVYLSTTS